MSIQLVTPPASEPVTVTDALAFLRQDGTDVGNVVASLISVGREHVERYCGRALMTQTWDASFDDFIERDRRFKTGLNFPGTNLPVPYGGSSRWAQQWPLISHLELPMPPVQSVTSVKYIDPNGVQQTLDPSVYIVDLASEPARLYLAPGQVWPAYRNQRNAITVRCVCGYADAGSVPATLQLAVKSVVANFYENREPVSLVSGAQPYVMPLGIQELLAPYVVDRF